MDEYLKYNLNSYLIKKDNIHNKGIIIAILMLLSVLLFTYKYELTIKTTINVETICENEDCSIRFYKNIKDDFSFDNVEINKNKYKVKDLKIGEVTLDSSNDAYQEITLKLKDYQGVNNEITKLQIIKNKEKFITKIFKIIVERDL